MDYYITKMIDHKPKRYTKIETKKYQMYSVVNLIIIFSDEVIYNSKMLIGYLEVHRH